MTSFRLKFCLRMLRHLSNYGAFCVMQNKVMKPSDSSVCVLVDVLSSFSKATESGGTDLTGTMVKY